MLILQFHRAAKALAQLLASEESVVDFSDLLAVALQADGETTPGGLVDQAEEIMRTERDCQFAFSVPLSRRCRRSPQANDALHSIRARCGSVRCEMGPKP
jgi:hypothetical protein